MKTGDIFLVHTNSKMGKIIQGFQSKEDPESGKWNHSGIILMAASGAYVVEEAEIEGYKLKAAAIITPLDEYKKRNEAHMKEYGEPRYKFMLLEYKRNYDRLRIERLLFKWVGLPYDYPNLLKHQIVLKLFGWWSGKNKRRAARRMVCHEFTQFIWEKQLGIFPDWNKARVADIYNSKHFIHKPLTL